MQAPALAVELIEIDRLIPWKWARYFIERGYVVIAAINPCSKTWLPREDFIALCEKFKQIGVRHVVIEVLSMSPTRLRKINEARKVRMQAAK